MNIPFEKDIKLRSAFAKKYNLSESQIDESILPMLMAIEFNNDLIVKEQNNFIETLINLNYAHQKSITDISSKYRALISLAPQIVPKVENIFIEEYDGLLWRFGKYFFIALIAIVFIFSYFIDKRQEREMKLTQNTKAFNHKIDSLKKVDITTYNKIFKKKL